MDWKPDELLTKADPQPARFGHLSEFKMHHIFCNDPDDVSWLKEVHLAHLASVPEFKSFELIGNEDAPESVTLYEQMHPTVLDTPVRCLKQDRKGLLN